MVFVFGLLLILGLVGCVAEPAVETVVPSVVAPTQIIVPTTTPTELILPTAYPTETAVPDTPTPFPTPTATPIPTPIIYTIQAGETVLGIAIAQNTTTEAILALNPDLRPEALQIGQTIILPPPTTAVSNPSTGQTPTISNVTVSQMQTYDTPVGGFWLIGEVANVGEEAVENMQVEIRFLDDGGAVRETAVTWVANPIVQAGELAPFALLLPQKPTFAQLDTAVIGGNVVAELGERYTNLQVTQLNLNTDEPAAQIAGTVQNIGEDTAVAMQLILTLYDSEKRIVGFVVRSLDGELLAGEEREFKETAVSLGTAIDDVTLSLFAYKIGVEDE